VVRWTRGPRALGCAVALAAVAACSHDWEAYDPRLGGGGPGGGDPCLPGETEACYGGPEGTEGVGACVAGARTCSPAGAFGACEGEVTPAAEDCDTEQDDDCDGEPNQVELCGCVPSTAVDCYEGPDGTLGVGVCLGGSKICEPDGMSYGPCLAQVLPAVESCATAGVDEDCNGLDNDRCAVWAKRFGGSQDQYANAFALAADGGIVFTGDLAGSTNFGGGTLTSAGSSDLLVVRLDAAGEYVWASRFGNSATQSGRALALDPDGNILVAGSFVGTLDFGGATLPLTSAGSEDIFVAKLDPLGEPLWSVRFGNSVAQSARGLAVAADGSVFVTGELAGAVDFGVDTVASAGQTDGFLLKLDADGAPLWVHGFGGSSTDGGAEVALGAGGAVHLTGFFTGAITIAGAPLVADGGNDVLVAKLTADGAHLWSRSFGAADTQRGAGIAVAPGGDVLVAGTFAGGIDLGRGEVASLGAVDGFALRLDSGGEVLWSALFQGDDQVTPQGIAVDATGNTAITGGFRGKANFGGGDQMMAGPDDFFLVVLDPAGAYRYSRIFGDFGDQDARAVSFAPDGSLFLLGEISATTDFGTGPLTSAGGEDIVVVKLAP